MYKRRRGTHVTVALGAAGSSPVGHPQSTPAIPGVRRDHLARRGYFLLIRVVTPTVRCTHGTADAEPADRICPLANGAPVGEPTISGPETPHLSRTCSLRC
jgi:hypothetical protein